LSLCWCSGWGLFFYFLHPKRFKHISKKSVLV
jgi:hypothetical protein